MTTNTYDGDGKRVTLTESTHTSITYVYDVHRGLPEVLQDGLHKNVWGLRLAYTVSMDGQNTVQVPHTDGLGSVRALTDSTGTVVEDYQTDAFGVPTSTDGPNYQQRFAYGGEQRDYDGLLYLRARFYEPVLGRFMGRDPYGGSPGAPLSLNRFSFVANSPVTGSDASGLAVATDSAGGGPTDGGSQVKDDGSNDPLLQCDEPSDKPELQVLNLTCTPPQALVEIPVTVLSPSGAYWWSLSFAVSPTPSGGAPPANLFDKAGIKTTEHFRWRLIQRLGRGVTERAALDAYNSGRLFYDPVTRNYIRYDSQTQVAVVNRPSGGKALTVFEGNPSPRWNPVPWRPGS